MFKATSLVTLTKEDYHSVGLDFGRPWELVVSFAISDHGHYQKLDSDGFGRLYGITLEIVARSRELCNGDWALWSDLDVIVTASEMTVGIEGLHRFVSDVTRRNYSVNPVLVPHILTADSKVGAWVVPSLRKTQDRLRTFLEKAGV